VDERDQDICERTISDAECLLTDEDRLRAQIIIQSLIVNTFSREIPRRRSIIYTSKLAAALSLYILQEALAYNCSQLLKSVNSAKTLLHYLTGVSQTKRSVAGLDADTNDLPNPAPPLKT
jgi:hypothetical protein